MDEDHLGRPPPGSVGPSMETDSNGNEDGSDPSEPSGALDAFRRRWQRELEETSGQGRAAHEQSMANSQSKGRYDPTVAQGSIEVQARQLFQLGVRAEQCGKLYEAVAFYRRAVQLVPDIEFRMAEDASKIQHGTLESPENGSLDLGDDPEIPVDNEEEEDEDDEADEDDESDLHDLPSRFRRLASRRNSSFCRMGPDPQQGTHLSSLPVEVFLYILKWVVSSDLDLHSLEQVSMVCRGFYLCARDPEIWHLICLRIWGMNCGLPTSYGGWREMCLCRPRVNFNGAYISRTTYVRYGDASCQDTTYKPCYLVEYFRYLRFFPEGLVLMLTTADDPHQSLPRLLHRRPSHPCVMQGHFRLVGSTVVAVLRRTRKEGPRRTRRGNLNPLVAVEQEQDFHLELEVRTVKGRLHNQLVWRNYAVHTCSRLTGQTSVSQFDLTPTTFPPFWFSRVRSYAERSVSPLAL